jgi:hypothetical protein
MSTPLSLTAAGLPGTRGVSNITSEPKGIELGVNRESPDAARFGDRAAQEEAHRHFERRPKERLGEGELKAWPEPRAGNRGSARRSVAARPLYAAGGPT